MTTGQDILDAIGVPPADLVDADWADACAAAADAYVARLPCSKEVPVPPDVQQGTLMLGVNLYRRRPAGVLAPDSDPGAAAAVDGTISRLLRIGFYADPVVS